MAVQSSSSGRPRDPRVDERITRAAVQLFGQAGWARFSVDAVSRASGVGKQSIYLRWRSKEELLTDALTARLTEVADADTGTVRGDLLELGRQMMDLHIGDWREAVLRMNVEAAHIPGIRRHWAKLRKSQVLAARAMVRRGIERGEIPASTPATLVLDALCGGIVMHTTTIPDEHLQALRDDPDSYVVELVDFLLARAGAVGVASGGPACSSPPTSSSA